MPKRHLRTLSHGGCPTTSRCPSVPIRHRRQIEPAHAKDNAQVTDLPGTQGQDLSGEDSHAVLTGVVRTVRRRTHVHRAGLQIQDQAGARLQVADQFAADVQTDIVGSAELDPLT